MTVNEQKNLLAARTQLNANKRQVSTTSEAALCQDTPATKE